MNPKKLSALVLLAVMAPFAVAQTVDDEIEFGRAVVQTERQAIAAASLELTPSESEEFWPVYREYRTDIAVVNDRLVDLIEGFAASYDSMTGDQALAMVNEFFAIEKKVLKVRQRHLRKFRKILPARKLARFVQIENKMDAIIRYELAAEIPLAR